VNWYFWCLSNGELLEDAFENQVSSQYSLQDRRETAELNSAIKIWDTHEINALLGSRTSALVSLNEEFVQYHLRRHRVPRCHLRPWASTNMPASQMAGWMRECEPALAMGDRVELVRSFA